MIRRPLRIINFNDTIPPYTIRENECMMFIEKGLLKIHEYGDAIRNVSGLRVADSLNNIVSISSADIVKFTSNYIKDSAITVNETTGEVEIAINLNITSDQLIDILHYGSNIYPGLVYLNSIAGLNDVTDNAALTPYGGYYLSERARQHTANITSVLTDVATFADIQTSYPNPVAGQCVYVADQTSYYTYDKYLKLPRIVGTYALTGYDGSYPSAAITNIAMFNVDDEFISNINAGSISHVIINNIECILSKLETTPANVNDLCARYDIDPIYASKLTWFYVVDGVFSTINNMEKVYIQQFEKTYVSKFILDKVKTL